jgi:hypothetical protein
MEPQRPAMTTYAYLYQAIYLNDPGSAKLYLPEAGTRIEKIPSNVTFFSSLSLN